MDELTREVQEFPDELLEEVFSRLPWRTQRSLSWRNRQRIQSQRFQELDRMAHRIIERLRTPRTMFYTAKARIYPWEVLVYRLLNGPKVYIVVGAFDELFDMTWEALQRYGPPPISKKSYHPICYSASNDEEALVLLQELFRTLASIPLHQVAEIAAVLPLKTPSPW